MQQQQKYSLRKNLFHNNGRQISRFISALVWMKLTLLVSVPLALAQTGTYNAGSESQVNGDFATAVGSKAQSGVNGIALGFEANATGSVSIAIGAQTTAASSSTVLGASATSYARDALAVGLGARAGSSSGNHQYSTAIGAVSVATGLRSTAVGHNSSAAANKATAVGQLAKALHANSAAFGQGATTSRENQQIFGNETNTYTLPGLTSQASTNAQTSVGVSVVLTDSNGNLATDDGTFLTQAIRQEMESSVTNIKTNTASINSHAGSIRANAEAIQALSSGVGDDLLNTLTGPNLVEHHAGLIQQNVESLETNAQAIEANAQALEANAQSVRNNAADIRRNTEGVALALAMSAPNLRSDQKFSFSAGYGNFDSGSALAISSSLRLSEKISISLGGGIGLDSSVGGGKAVFTFAK